MVKRVTDRAAVEAAMDEYDQIGRDAFLAKYRFGPALRYFVTRHGNRYDSKAIYGAAHRIQFPEDGDVDTNDFSGGEQVVQRPLEALGYEFAIDPPSEAVRPPEESGRPPTIRSEDLRLIISSRRHQYYREIREEAHAAYLRVASALKALGERMRAALANPDKFEVRTTSGFHPQAGVRGRHPKDLWFSVSPRSNTSSLAAMPQAFMIVSTRGIEYGYGASVHPNDLSNQDAKQAIRSAAPIVFASLPSSGSEEANELESAIATSGGWHFRRKHRLDPGGSDLPDLDAWLSFLKSPDGAANAAGTISRYITVDEIDAANLTDGIIEAARLFDPLLDREWRHRADENVRPAELELNPPVSRETSSERRFAEALQLFLDVFAARRESTFGKSDDLDQTVAAVRSWVVNTDAVARRSNIKVDISVGKGNWTKTPWIALLDERVTQSTQRGIYIVFLIAADLKSVYLTLNQGMTDLVEEHGRRLAREEMDRVAKRSRTVIIALERAGFTLDNAVDLRTDNWRAKNYEAGTIAHLHLPISDIPPDAVVEDWLEALLSAYESVIENENGVDTDPSVTVSPAAEPQAPHYTVDDLLNDVFLEREDVERYLDIWRNKKNLILQGAPGVGKSFVARRLAYALIGFKDERKVQSVQFHQSYSYEDFVQGYRPDGNQGFELKNGVFYEFRNRALQDPDGTYVIIIDEINRGNLSKIFGELMLLIEQDKRGHEWRTRLAYASSDDPEFFVPENLFILGMMNTADRSLSLVDYALRRRFAFIAMEPLFGAPKFRTYLEAHRVPEEVINRITSGMGELNQVIENDRVNLGPGFRVGHSFFTPTEQVSDSETWFRRVVETEIYPLLEEYWFDSPETADQWRDRLLR